MGVYGASHRTGQLGENGPLRPSLQLQPPRALHLSDTQLAPPPDRAVPDRNATSATPSQLLRHLSELYPTGTPPERHPASYSAT
jgi:hypothetical protein